MTLYIDRCTFCLISPRKCHFMERNFSLTNPDNCYFQGNIWKPFRTTYLSLSGFRLTLSLPQGNKHLWMLHKQKSGIITVWRTSVCPIALIEDGYKNMNRICKVLFQSLLSADPSLPLLAQEQACPWLWSQQGWKHLENTGQGQRGYNGTPLFQPHTHTHRVYTYI